MEEKSGVRKETGEGSSLTTTKTAVSDYSGEDWENVGGRKAGRIMASDEEEKDRIKEK